MPLISINVEGKIKKVSLAKASTILQAIRQADIKFETPCNGMGLCGKCKVIAKGELEAPELNEEKFIDTEKGERLACITKVLGDAEVEIIRKNKSIKTVNSGITCNVDVNSNIKLVSIGSIEKDCPKPFIESIDYVIKNFMLLKKVEKLEKESLDEKNTVQIYGVIYNNELIDIQIEKTEILAVAIDIGTTGVSAYLIDLKNGQILKKASALNPQTEVGGDVITRMAYCMNNEEGVLKLQRLIVDEINALIEQLIFDKYQIDEIYSMTVAGNTTMLHLFSGINPYYMAKAPYRPIFLDSAIIEPEKIGITINPLGKIILLPGTSAYVGADIISGIAASGFNKKEWNSLFIDIGTNGEIAAICNGKMICTSTAAGPALEGMNISCGLRAENGAIEAFQIDENYNISFCTIGNAEAQGICGSGLIDLVSELLRRNIILQNGRLNSHIDNRIGSRIKDKKFYITDSIYLSQKDIRQIQLAKGAIAAGIKMLLEKINLPMEKLNEVIIAGAFGYHINAASILNIGLIPKGFEGKILFAGNTSIEGARLAAINKLYLEEMNSIKNEMQTLELSTDSKFQEYFIKELNF